MSRDDSNASSKEVDCPRGCGTMEYRKNKNMGRRVFHPLGTPLTFLGLAGIALALKSLNSIENEGALTNSEIITFIVELFPGVALLFLGLHFTSLVTSDLFCGTCNGIILESKSIDKVVNQDNMNYGDLSFKKSQLRAKNVKVRHILDNSSTTHIVSQFIVAPAQISYK